MCPCMCAGPADTHSRTLRTASLSCLLLLCLVGPQGSSSSSFDGSEACLLRVARDVSLALAFMHQRGIVHMDVKASHTPTPPPAPPPWPTLL